MNKESAPVSSALANHAAPEHERPLDRIGRREFIGQLATGAALAGVTLGMASPQVLADDAPKMGGHLKIGTDGASTTDSLDPRAGRHFPISCRNADIRHFDRCRRRGHFVPHLAESWSASPDAKRWVFKIRSGVTFHNGKSLTAADVVYSLNLHRGKDSKSGAKGYLTSVTDIKATAPSGSNSCWTAATQMFHTS